MPGYELIGDPELNQIQDIFQNGSILFRHGFDSVRNNCFKVKEFESRFSVYQTCSHSCNFFRTAALRVALASLSIGPGTGDNSTLLRRYR